jgi:hypothetical protein
MYTKGTEIVFPLDCYIVCNMYNPIEVLEWDPLVRVLGKCLDVLKRLTDPTASV